MCRMNVVVNKLVLGNRELGFECWDGKQIAEFTAKQLKDMIRAGKQKVCGKKSERMENQNLTEKDSLQQT